LDVLIINSKGDLFPSKSIAAKDQIIAFKALRILNRKGFFADQDKIKLRSESLLDQLVLPSDLVRYQLLSLFFESLQYDDQLKNQKLQETYANNLTLYSQLFEEDLILEEIFSNQYYGRNAAIEEHVISKLTNLKEHFQQITLNIADSIPKSFRLGSLSLLKRNFLSLQEDADENSDLVQKKIDFVHTSTVKKNLQQLMQAVMTEQPILLQGELGCGKSALIRELAKQTNNEKDLIVLYINDQTDGKSLIGSYVCTDVPGEFIWEAGVITRAVMKGYWLVIEDIDRVNLEIVSMLSLLLESRLLLLPFHSKPIRAHYNFRLFGTRTMKIHSSLTPHGPEDTVTIFSSSTMLFSQRNFSQIWHYITFETLPTEEIREIIDVKYPAIRKTLIDNLFQIMIPTSLTVAISNNKGRPLTLVEILKLANRFQLYPSSEYLTDNTQGQIVLDIIDVLYGKVRIPDRYLSLMKELVALLRNNGFLRHSIESLTNDIPEIINNRMGNQQELKVGRATLICASEGMLSSSSSSNANSLKDAMLLHDRKEQTSSSANFALTNYSKRFIEKLAVSVQMKEPVLLVGETGGGKTTTVQELASLLGKQLHVQNLSLGSDVNDLLGGYRPVSIRQLLLPYYEQFLRLFQPTFISPATPVESREKAEKYLKTVARFFSNEEWAKLLNAFETACMSATKNLAKDIATETRVEALKILNNTMEDWEEFRIVVKRLQNNLQKIENGFAFSFQKGLLYDAMQNGYWILLDEINLASSETLQILSNILDFKNNKIYTDVNDKNDKNGDGNCIHVHKEFFLFAAMNPPTDICKKELPESLRNRFTEFYVPELTDAQDLTIIVSKYLQGFLNDAEKIRSIVDVYLQCRTAAESILSDGAGLKPRYSLRSLTRSLKAALSFKRMGLNPLGRCLYEGFLLNFQSLLNEKSRELMDKLLKSALWTESEGKSEDKEEKITTSSKGSGKRKSDGKEKRKETEFGDSDSAWTSFRPFKMKTGPLPTIDWTETNNATNRKFIPTPAVKKHIRTIAAAISANVSAILLQGPTSVGKTTMIQYIAAKAGYKCVRINNHEQTDIQEYLGTYVTGPDGRLAFQYGLLVEALKNGYWIILDELNLAPSDILEALNRLLDDNREILIPETGEIVKPAPGFYLFATQNPPGIYGGRKPLSLAFRNRFVEIDIPDLPADEIVTIIEESCGIANKFARMLVNIMLELQKNRQNSSLLLGKYGSLTVRDLIKWGKRSPQSALDVAREGYMLLVEKLRTQEEKAIVIKILSDVCKVNLQKEIMFPPSQELVNAYTLLKNSNLHLVGVSGIAITSSFNRMWTLLWHALEHNEPVLLIGETGCGKTMVSQLYAAYKQQNLKILNCHQSTETSDFIGGYRPVRGREVAKQELIQNCQQVLQFVQEQRLSTAWNGLSITQDTSDTDLDVFIKKSDGLLQSSGTISSDSSMAQLLQSTKALQVKLQSIFEWQDGPLIEAMSLGELFLIDEINLAEDAVIERINSVLEFHSEITLAEKGSSKEIEKLIAHPNFKIIATMNPSGDYGKRELSPALRSRFTEIWIPSISDPKEIQAIIEEILSFPAELNTSTHSTLNKNLSEVISASILLFIDWINTKITQEMAGKKILISIREILAWTSFIQQLQVTDVQQAMLGYFHGAFLIILDGLGVGQHYSRDLIKRLKLEAFQFLLSLLPPAYEESIRLSSEYLVIPTKETVARVLPHRDEQSFIVGTFKIPLGHSASIKQDSSYAFDTPTTILNLGRILRGLQIHRPILLEGPPGIGKSSIIHNLALATGHKLVRINLSEHTELSDLLGSDLPMSNTDSSSPGENAPKFKWYDGIFLTAMKEGSWVLLDELNLAPQNVLEGLNACFDHRETVYIPEICQSVACAKTFRVFCTQNPMNEGGGRKGLPSSFLSRFTRVFVEALNNSDLYEIITKVIYDNKATKSTGAAEDEEPMMVTTADHPSHSLEGNTLLFHYFPDDEFLGIIAKMVSFITELDSSTSLGNFGRVGAPWEFNLRDVFRWYELLKYLLYENYSSLHLEKTLGFDHSQLKSYFVSLSIYLLFVLRLRTTTDREQIIAVFQKFFEFPLNCHLLSFHDSFHHFQDLMQTKRNQTNLPHNFSRVLSPSNDLFDRSHQSLDSNMIDVIQAMDYAVQLQWPVLAIGAMHSGKRKAIEYLAHKYHRPLHIFSVIPSLDSSELLGSFEQATIQKKFLKIVERLQRIISNLLSKFLSLPFQMDISNEESGNSFLQWIANKLRVLLLEINELEKKVSLLDSSHSSNSEGASLQIDTSISSLFQLIMNELLSLSSSSPSHTTKDSLSSFTENLAAVQHSLQELYQELKICFTADGKLNDNYRGVFTWENGVVVDAVIHGHWLILDNINLATSSVLDRINSILEPNGSIILTEDGTGKEIFPHKNFRIFFTMDPNYGEISRAMRNRCLEIYFLKENHSSDLQLQLHSKELIANTPFKKLRHMDLTNLFFTSLKLYQNSTSGLLLTWGRELIRRFTNDHQSNMKESQSFDVHHLNSKLEGLLKKCASIGYYDFAEENQFNNTVIRRFALSSTSHSNVDPVNVFRNPMILNLLSKPEEIICFLVLFSLLSREHPQQEHDQQPSKNDLLSEWILLIVQREIEKELTSFGTQLPETRSFLEHNSQLREFIQSFSASNGLLLLGSDFHELKEEIILFFIQFLAIKNSSNQQNYYIISLLLHFYFSSNKFQNKFQSTTALYQQLTSETNSKHSKLLFSFFAHSARQLHYQSHDETIVKSMNLLSYLTSIQSGNKSLDGNYQNNRKLTILLKVYRFLGELNAMFLSFIQTTSPHRLSSEEFHLINQKIWNSVDLIWCIFSQQPYNPDDDDDDTPEEIYPKNWDYLQLLLTWIDEGLDSLTVQSEALHDSLDEIQQSLAEILSLMERCSFNQLQQRGEDNYLSSEAAVCHINRRKVDYSQFGGRPPLPTFHSPTDGIITLVEKETAVHAFWNCVEEFQTFMTTQMISRSNNNSRTMKSSQSVNSSFHLTHDHYQDEKQIHLFRDYLALFSTFYLNYTNQIPSKFMKNAVNGTSTRSSFFIKKLIPFENFSLLVEKLKTQFIDYYTSYAVLEFNELIGRLNQLEITERETFLFTNDVLKDRIALETKKQILKNVDHFLYEYIAQELLTIRDLIAFIYSSIFFAKSPLTDDHLVSELLHSFSQLSNKIKKFVELYLHYSLNNPIYLRELQMIQWVLDAAVLFQTKNLSVPAVQEQWKDCWEILGFILQKSLVSLDNLVYLVSNQSSSQNSLFSHVSNYSFMTPTIKLFFDRHRASDDENHQYPSTGLLQQQRSRNEMISQPKLDSVAVHSILKLTDINLLVPNVNIGPVRNVVRENTERILTVSSFQDAKTSLLLSFQSLLFVNVNEESEKEQILHNSERRVLRILSYLLEVLCSSTEFFSREGQEFLASLISSVQSAMISMSTSPNSALVIQTIILPLLNHRHAVMESVNDSNMKYLFENCLFPICEKLSMLTTVSMKEEMRENLICYCSTMIGIIRLQFLVPDSLLDPAIEPLYKSELLKTKLKESKGQIISELIINSFQESRNKIIFNQSVIDKMVGHEMISKEISVYEDDIIIRPKQTENRENTNSNNVHSMANQSKYSELVLLLQSFFMNGPLEFMKLLEFMERASPILFNHQETVNNTNKVQLFHEITMILTNIQSMMDTLNKNFSFGYEDVNVPIFSCLENICSGITGIYQNLMKTASINALSINKLHSEDENTLISIIHDCLTMLSFTSFDADEKIDSSVLTRISTLAEKLFGIIQKNNFFTQKETLLVNPLVQHALYVLYYLLIRLDAFLGMNCSVEEENHHEYRSVISQSKQILEFFVLKYFEYLKEKELFDRKNASMYDIRDEEELKKNAELKEEQAFRQSFPNYLEDLHPIKSGITNGNEEEEDDNELVTRSSFPSSSNERKKSLNHNSFVDPFDEKVLFNIVNILTRIICFDAKTTSSLSSGLPMKERLSSVVLNAHFADLLFMKNYELILQNSNNINDKQQQGKTYDGLLLHAIQFNAYFNPLSATSFMKSTGKESKRKGKKQQPEILTQSPLIMDKDLLLLFNPLYLSYYLPSSMMDSVTPEEAKNSPFAALLDYQPKDFHHDYSLTEIVYLIPSLNGILTRCSYLLKQFPSNELLIKIMKFIQQIYYEFSVTSSLGKLLISLQLLLKVTEEWEINSPKLYSFSEQIMDLSLLINRWRKIELRSWTHLLRTKEISIIQNKLITQNYFFHLYKIYFMDLEEFLRALSVPKFVARNYESYFHRNKKSLSSVAEYNSSSAWKSLLTEDNTPDWIFSNEDKTQKKVFDEELTEEDQKRCEAFDKEVSSYLTKLLNTLDSLLRSSTVGEFPILLHSLRVMCLLLSKDISHFEEQEQSKRKSKKPLANMRKQELFVKHSMKKRIMKLSFGIWEYYSSFLVNVRRFQELMMKPIQEKITNEVKLGKWDSLNIYALLENSEKINRKLNKIIKEYEDEVLAFPVFTLLQKDLCKDLISENGELIPSLAVPANSSLFPHLTTTTTTTSQNQKTNETTFLNSILKHPLFSQSSKGSQRTEESSLVITKFPNLLKFQTRQKRMMKFLNNLFNFNHFQFLQEELEQELSSQRKPKLLKPKEENSAVGEQQEEMKEEANEEISEEMKQREREIAVSNTKTISYGLQSHYFIESSVSDIFARMDSLRQENTTKPMKQKSVRDLLIALQEFGFSTLRSALPPMFNEKNLNEFILEIGKEIPSMKMMNSLSSPSSSSSVSLSSEVLERGEYYYYRNIMEFNQLKTQSHSMHTNDLSQKEILHMVILSENMIFQNVKLRLSMESSMREWNHFQSLQSQLQDYLFSFEESSTLLADVSHEQSVESINTRYSHQLQKVYQLMIILLEFNEIIRAAIESETLVQKNYEENGLNLDLSHLKVFEIENLKALQQFVESSVEQMVLFFEGSKRINQLEELSAFNSTNVISFNEKRSALSQIQSVLTDVQSKFVSYEQTVISLSTRENYQRIFDLVEGLLLSNKNDHHKMIEDQNDENLASHEEKQNNPVATPEKDKLTSSFLEKTDKTVTRCLKVIERLNGLTSSIQNYLTNASVDETAMTAATIEKSLIGCFGEVIFSSNTTSLELNLTQLISLTIYSFHCFQLVNLSENIESLLRLLRNPALLSQSTEEKSLKRNIIHQLINLLSFIQSSYQLLFQQLLLVYKTMNKFTYIIIRIFRNLLVKGICANPAEDSEDQNKDENKKDDLSQMKFDGEGTGMGEGEGQKDVSDQIENEEQLLGLKNEPKDENEQSNEEKKEKKEKLNKEEQEKGMEMNEDFEGEMYDLEQEQEEEEKEDEEEEEDEEEKEDPEREMGEANYDDIIDEKQWDSEDDEEEENKDKDGKEQEQKQKEKMEKDTKSKGKKLEEMVTGEEEDEEEDNKDRKEGDQEEMNEANDENENEDEEEDGKVNEDNEEDYLDKPQGMKVKENPKEKENEEKKDNENEEEEGEEEEEVEGEKEEGEEAGEGMDFDEVDENAAQNQPEGEEQKEGEEEKDQEINLPDDLNIDGEKEEGENDENQENNNEQMEIDSINDEEEQPLEDENEEKPPPLHEPMEKKEKQKKNKPMAFGVQSMESEEQIINDQDEEKKKPELNQEKQKKGPRKDQPQSNAPEKEEQVDQEDQPPPQSSEGGGPDNQKTTSNQRNPPPEEENNKNKSSAYKEPANPFLSKGNIEKEWFRRLNITNNLQDDALHDENEEDEDNDENQQNRGQGEYEYDQNQANENKPMEQVLGKDNNKQQDQNNALQQPMLDDSNEIKQQQDQESQQQQQQEDNQQQQGRHLFDETKPDDDENLSSKRKLQEEKEAERKRQMDEEHPNSPQKKKQKTNTSAEEEEEKKKKQKMEKHKEELSEEYPEELEDESEKPTSMEEMDYLENKKPVNTNSQFNFGQFQESEDEEEEMGSEEEEEIDEIMKGIIYEDENDDQALTLTTAEKQVYLQEWNVMKQKTEMQSIQLSESLKLILEPMLLTKLQGYYRSGKKISMKKIISYISSNYRKDKIWLKRKKPNQRNYQIFLLVDNSKSMKFLSKKTMEIISLLLQTFSKLEIGSLSIGTFGEKLKILFPFPNMTYSHPLSSESTSKPTKQQQKHQKSQKPTVDPTTGAWASTGNALMLNDENTLHLLSNLTFNSNSTQLNDCLNDSIPYLTQAKELLTMSSSMMSSGSMVLQLCFIISDARIDSQNRAELEKIIQKMSEEHILVILLIIDDPSITNSEGGNKNKDQSNSILNTKVIKFNAKGELEKPKSYFEEFPFPYYIIVQNIQQLPEILADALKQWFELIKLQLSSNQN
jgi:midasin